MTLRVLTAANEADRRRWHEVLERYAPAVRDLHYLPEYGLVYRDSYRHEPMLAVFERGNLTAMHAFVRRSLDDLGFLAEAGCDPYFDIATPYGFGGPLLSAARADGAEDCLREFDAAFTEWGAQQGFASEFVCLHPVLENHAALAAIGVVQPQAAKQVVIVDVGQSEEALWSGLSRGTRSNIQRARREGVCVQAVSADDAALEVFGRLYVETMRRRGAASRWFFPPSYFGDCMRRLGSGRSVLFFARCGEEVAAAYLLLHDGNTAYYHFGASAERWLDRRPTHLLMYETILWARRQGLSRYHLGGGVTASENDSLLRFKSSFGGGRSMLYTYGRILNAAVYAELCDLKLRHEAGALQPPADPEYFPFYRR